MSAFFRPQFNLKGAPKTINVPEFRLRDAGS